MDDEKPVVTVISSRGWDSVEAASPRNIYSCRIEGFTLALQRLQVVSTDAGRRFCEATAAVGVFVKQLPHQAFQ